MRHKKLYKVIAAFIYKMNLILLTLSFIFTTNAIKPNFCVNCKHFKYDFFSGKQFGKCMLFPILKEKDRYYLVNGQEKKTEYNYCSIARGYNDMCGEEGKLFEKKYK